MLTMKDVLRISIYLTDKPKRQDEDAEGRKYYFFSEVFLNKVTLSRAVLNITDILTYSPTANKLLKEGECCKLIQDETSTDSRMPISEIKRVELHSNVLFFTYVIFLSYFRFFDYRKSDIFTPILKHFKQLKFCAENPNLGINEKVTEVRLTAEEEAFEQAFFENIQNTFLDFKNGSISDMLRSIMDTYDKLYAGVLIIDIDAIEDKLDRFDLMDHPDPDSTDFREDEFYRTMMDFRESLTEEDFDSIKRIIDDICSPKLARTYVDELASILNRYEIDDVYDERRINAAKRDRSPKIVKKLEEAIRIKRQYPDDFAVHNIE